MNTMVDNNRLKTIEYDAELNKITKLKQMTDDR